MYITQFLFINLEKKQIMKIRKRKYFPNFNKVFTVVELLFFIINKNTLFYVRDDDVSFCSKVLI